MKAGTTLVFPSDANLSKTIDAGGRVYIPPDTQYVYGK